MRQDLFPELAAAIGGEAVDVQKIATTGATFVYTFDGVGATATGVGEGD